MSDRVSRSVLEFSTTGDQAVVAAYDKIGAKAKEASGSIGGLGGQMGALTSAFKGFLALEVTQRLVAVVGTVRQAVDEFDTLAGRIDASVEDAQQLKALATTFDTELGAIVTAIQTMREKLGEGHLDATLRAINIEVDAFRKLDGKEQYLQVAEALGRIEDPARRAALAKAALGRQAKELATTFREDVREGMGGVITISNDTAESIDMLSRTWDKAKQSAVAFTAQLLAQVTGMEAYVRLKEAFGAPELPTVSPATLAVGIQGVRDLTQHERELRQVEEELTQTARARIEANEDALKAAEKRQQAERDYYDWLGEREIAAAQATQERVDQEAAAYRAFYDWLGQRRMEDEAAAMASHQRLAQSAAQMFQSMMASGSTWNGTGLGMLRGTVPMDSPTAGSGGSGGGFRLRSLLGPGLSMLGGIIPGQSQLGSGIGSALGQSLGSMKKFAESAFGAVLGPLGGILGGLAGNLIGKLFGGEAKETRKQRNAWVESVGGIDALKAAAAAAGVSLDRLFAARKVKDFEAEQKKVVAAIERHKALLEEMQALEAERARLVEETTVGYAQMRDVAERFGINQEGLGQSFQQGRLGTDAQSLIDGIETMRRGGADMGTVLFGMRDEISALVRDSAKFGTEIPENLRPFIEHLLETGNLLDENGDVMKELPSIKFGEAMRSELDKASDKLAEVVGRLADVLSRLDALNGKQVSFGVSGTYTGPDDAGSGSTDGTGFAVGTAGRGGFWRDFGSATRTVLHGIEAVVRPDQAVGFARSILGAGGDVGGTPLVIQMDGQVAARAMIRRTGRTLSLVGA